jgi:hypothetical protein
MGAFSGFGGWGFTVAESVSNRLPQIFPAGCRENSDYLPEWGKAKSMI